MLIILREARRLTGMVEELLEFTRMQDGRFTLNIETADILAEFEDTVFMYGSRLKQEGITLNYDGCDEEIPEILCDIARMRQVFLNILDNAAKHGGDGKRIDAAISGRGWRGCLPHPGLWPRHPGGGAAAREDEILQRQLQGTRQRHRALRSAKRS